MEEIRNRYKILVRKPNGKRSLERPGHRSLERPWHRWKDIKMVIKE
jgi:hypothetical protein